MKTIKTLLGLSGACLLVITIGTASAGIFPEKDGYLIDPVGNFVRNGTDGCWRTIHWTPETAFEECDPGLAKKEAQAVAMPVPPPPPPVVERKPEPPVIPAKPAMQVSFTTEALFDFDMAVLKPSGRQALDEQIVMGMRSHPEVELLIVTGHADRIGTDEYNMRLSERRANAVRNYLIQQGVAAGIIKVVAKGESEPDPEANTRETCRGLDRSRLIACLQPDRRVTVQSQWSGMGK